MQSGEITMLCTPCRRTPLGHWGSRAWTGLDTSVGNTGFAMSGKLVAREDIISGRVLRAEEEIRVPEMLRSEKFSMF